MSQTKLYIFTFLSIIIIVSEVSCWNDASGLYGLRKLDFFRRRFGPVKLSHTANTTKKESKGNEVPLNEDDEINQKEELIAIPSQVNDDNGTGIVQKDSMPSNDDPMLRKEKGLPPKRPKKVIENHSKKNCWMDADAKEHFELMDSLDDRYESVRTQYQEAAEKDNFSKDMLDMMIKTRGVAHREIHKAKGNPGVIPAGINLGGYGMLRLDESILFFHRMKLRNNTHFNVKLLKNDLANMALTAQLSLNDLHILGAYERASTQIDPVQLFYVPTYGEAEYVKFAKPHWGRVPYTLYLEEAFAQQQDKFEKKGVTLLYFYTYLWTDRFLLKNVEYSMEGRYRMLRGKLAIELIVSSIDLKDILLTYQNSEKAGKSVVLERKNIDEFLNRLKIDLDKWLKDYFNDYLMYFGLVGEKANAKFIEYNREKTIALNEYTDKILEKIGGRIRQLKLCAVRLPEFSITAVDGTTLKLTSGVLRGLESLHRRSIATGKRENELRKVNAIIGFSSLKATYQYEAAFNTGIPPINGMLVVTADEMIAHFSLTLTKDPETADLALDSIQQLQPESLTVEGPANRVIGSLKSLLERHVFTFISNAIVHNVIMLRTLTKCEPVLFSIHHVCDDEEENETKPSDTSTNGNKKENQTRLTPDNDEPNVEKDVGVNQNEQNNNSVSNNGGKENNEQSTGANKPNDVEIKIISNGDNANNNSEIQINVNTNNDKETNENATKNTDTNQDSGINDDKGTNENATKNNDTNQDSDIKNDKGTNENANDNTEANRDLDINNDKGNNENANDDTGTNRVLDTNDDKESNENANDDTGTNRDLDANNDEESDGNEVTGPNRDLDTFDNESKENDKTSLNNPGNTDDELNLSSAKNKKVNYEIVIIPDAQYNDGTETNINLDINNDKEINDNL